MFISDFALKILFSVHKNNIFPMYSFGKMETRKENLTTSITLHLNAIIVTDILMSITGGFSL